MKRWRRPQVKISFKGKTMKKKYISRGNCKTSSFAENAGGSPAYPGGLRSFLVTAILGLLVIVILTPVQAQAQADADGYAYVSRNYIITAEAAGKHGFMVNIINLSNYIIVVQSLDFIYCGESGSCYTGQVYELDNKDARGDMQRYTASLMIRERQFAGFKILGLFQERDAIKNMSVRIGARRLFLQPLEKIAFEQLMKKIQNIDIDNTESEAELELANIQEIGQVSISDGSPEWEKDWTDLLTSDGINPPKILENPEIEPTAAARKASSYGKIRLTGIVTKNGGIRDLKVTKGLGRGLDEQAMDGIRNSWVFLPGTQNGEVYETQITLEVEFINPDNK